MTQVLTLDSRVRINDEVLFQELEGEAVLLNLKTGVYFGLNAVGVHVWRLLGEHQRLADIVTLIVSEFEVTDEQCAKDILALAGDLTKQGLASAD